MPGQFTDFSTSCATFPFLGKGVGAADTFEERTRPHCSPDLEIPEIVGEIEKTIAELDAGHVLAHEHGLFRKFTLWHSPALPRSNTEQLGIEAEPASLIKPHNGSPISLTAIGVLPCAPRAAATSQPTSRRPAPSNDNDMPSEPGSVAA